MANRLIMFSGGVESTAVLTLADKDDIVMVCLFGNDTSETCNVQSVKAICAAFGLTPHFVKVEIPVFDKEQPVKHVHQVHRISVAAQLACMYNRQINEVWFGINADDMVTVPMDEYGRAQEVWAFNHPEVKIVFPLKHLTKLETWKTIPEHIRPLVTYCYFESNHCGHCVKCYEFEALVGNRWATYTDS